MSENHFGEADHASLYALFRPKPPQSLAQRAVTYLRSKNAYAEASAPLKCAVDVGCGSGQSTEVLAPHFEKVYGLDISLAQLEEARNASAYSNVEYRQGNETELDFPENSVDLVLTCQAIHWFDIDRFYQQSRKVLTRGGALAVVGYHLSEPAPSVHNHAKLTQLRDKLYEVTKPYWSPKRLLVDAGYATIPPLPFADRQRDDSHCVDVAGSLQDMLGYVTTWSGFRAYAKEQGQAEAEKMLRNFESQSKELLDVPMTVPASEVAMTLRTRYFMLLGRKEE